ncbi:MAG: hypothetical protein BWX77_00283 [Bacteroidetes bacterium ADurb.Bin090]|jgi:hypothetical protein|nr:MAG: hypothetical protein BWX77_00283 [Bacteroidetes bacterium ADurb.Bin090]
MLYKNVDIARLFKGCSLFQLLCNWIGDCLQLVTSHKTNHQTVY